MKKYRVRIIFLLFSVYIAVFTTQCTNNPCSTDVDCGSSYYCEKDVGDCFGDGECQHYLGDCAGEPVSPVCGCDGNTYDNECLANKAQVNLISEGACEGVETCTDNSDCSSGYFCWSNPDQIRPCVFLPGEEGICLEQPKLADCVDTGRPVCGCDFNTYENACAAAAFGVRIEREGTCEEDDNTETCTDNSECLSGDYCDKVTGDCNGDGTCITKPDSGSCTDTGSPVCGCDGNTYLSECLAQAAGVNVASEGACEGGETCTDNSSCSSGDYCDKVTGDCNGEGTCITKPDSGSCTDTGSPVCGCDGSTYDSECLAHVSGINVASEGACEGGETCTDNADCPEGSEDDYNCKKAAGDCEGTGTCVKAPDSCEPGVEPVCGCQGTTYDNECLAYQDGDNVFRNGSCETCTGNSDCPPDFFCDKDTGNCNGAGLGCAEKPEPEECTETGSPVCGCDGNTYESACEAQAEGVNLASEGACEGEETCTDNSECSSGDYCEKDVGDCDGEGICQTKNPEDCVDTGEPVCGCDGNTYNSDCDAQAMGVNVASDGACETM